MCKNSLTQNFRDFQSISDFNLTRKYKDVVVCLGEHNVEQWIARKIRIIEICLSVLDEIDK